jgi:AraC-like DNA-binding protein
MNFFWDILDMERSAVDLTFMGVVKWGREHLGERFDLREMRVKHAFWSAERPYLQAFGVPVVFGARRNELVMGAKCLDEVVTTANPELGCILNRQAGFELAHTPTVESFPSRVLDLIKVALLEGVGIDLVSLASTLKMSPRHLQRQLADRSTSFQALLDETRKTLAPGLLAKPSANVEQVGFQLGYSEPTAFIRAFKKWYGVTPGQARRNGV